MKAGTMKINALKINAQGLRQMSLLAATLLLPGMSLLNATAVVANPEPTQLQLAQAVAAGNDHPTYLRAKRELKPEMYTLYRIIDRLARANGLTETAWRVRVLPEYNINAFATEANLVGVYSGIMDSFHGDNSALACVVAHEQAHHTRRHIAVGTAQSMAITNQRNEESAKKQEEIRTSTTGGSAALGALGFGGFGGLLRADGERRAERAAKEKEAQRKSEIAALNRKQELEADELAYVYMARAGFDPQGCMRMFSVLSRTAGAEVDSDHPSVPSRISAMQDLMGKQPAANLRTEGQGSLNRSQPLTYGFSTDGQSLRINSQFGSGTRPAGNQDIRF
jgi:beta-barrel assembly-enhancing protease